MCAEMEKSEPQDQPFWKLARHGITLLLNNKQEEAEALFKKYPDNINMYAGYAASTFMDALMTFEEEKLAVSNQTLKETERRCSTAGWFSRGGRSKSEEENLSYAEYLEMEIIKADSQMYIATLAFLQQDITAYFKGGWILRKSWKHYQQTYNEIHALYKHIMGTPAPDFTENAVGSSTQIAQEECNASKKLTEFNSEMDINDKNELLHSSSSSCESIEATNTTSDKLPLRNGYFPKSHTIHFPPKSPNSNSCSSVASSRQPSPQHPMKKSQSVNSTLTKYAQRLTSPLNSSLAYISSLNPFNLEGVKPIDMDKETITRLMKGVSFGYGLLQMGMSLLPPSILKLTNFLGFQGNRKCGLTKLMYARTGDDMRAPLATLGLLWYHTIVRPFFALDGNNVKAGVQVAAGLIEDAMMEYSNSAIFLFFKGRVDRLKSDIPAAIESFNASIKYSQQRELRILAHHEVAWCYLILLDYERSLYGFLTLKNQSRWSRAFYTYMSAISAGAFGDFDRLGNWDEFDNIFTSAPKGSQLDEFLARRFKLFPKTKQEIKQLPLYYWKLLVYELLYLWNSLPSCDSKSLELIIRDCNEIVSENKHEPFLGLASLIAGSTYCIVRDYNNGIQSFRNCLEKRANTSYAAEDAHISAFASYELGQLLIKDLQTKAEGKQCLQKVHSYKDFDFEQRLSVRIHSILKHL